mmetsp:Transcript_661/g.1873  ORF Transcript_661/g.1873 Transcript_661/m.1873 type:complete len:252 (-) Transcript_661:1339-2094(-)
MGGRLASRSRGRASVMRRRPTVRGSAVGGRGEAGRGGAGEVARRHCRGARAGRRSRRRRLGGHPLLGVRLEVGDGLVDALEEAVANGEAVGLDFDVFVARRGGVLREPREHEVPGIRRVQPDEVVDRVSVGAAENRQFRLRRFALQHFTVEFAVRHGGFDEVVHRIHVVRDDVVDFLEDLPAHAELALLRVARNQHAARVVQRFARGVLLDVQQIVDVFDGHVLVHASPNGPRQRQTGPVRGRPQQRLAVR